MKIGQRILMITAVVLVAVVFAVSLFCGEKDASVSGYVMGSPVSITVYGARDGKQICEDAITRINFIDSSYLSHTAEASAIGTLNREKSIVPDKWFSDYMKKCVELSEKSDSFSLFCGEMKDVWQIENGGYVPTEDEIGKILENLRTSSLTIDDNRISLENGRLDLGALGKGTACDEAMELIKRSKVGNALITVGGTVGMIGSPDGENSFSIGVRDPFGTQNDYFAVLEVTDCFISTSGDYEKYFENNGVRYSHIFDATTGKPVHNDISSVTVIAESGMLSDFLSTLTYIEGIEKGVETAQDFDAHLIIVKKDKSVLVSKSLQDDFTLKDNSFTVSVI